MVNNRSIVVQPTGECWCGCGTRVDNGFFTMGHNDHARGDLMKALYGPEAGHATARFMLMHGLGPADQQLSPAERLRLVLAWAQEIAETIP